MTASVPTTGLARLDASIAVLADLEDVEIPDQPALFDAAHAALRDALVHAADTTHEPPAQA